MSETTLIGPLEQSTGDPVAAETRHDLMVDAGLLDPDQPTEHSHNKAARTECEHGNLRRSCERCADAETIAQLRAENERLRVALREIAALHYDGPRAGQKSASAIACVALGLTTEGE